MSKPIIIKQKILPFGPYKAVAIWPFIFTKVDLTEEKIHHELIHHRQQVELLVVFFYLAYVLNFMINIITMNKRPYRNIVFEREAYRNEADLSYLEWRPFWAWTKYL